MSGQKNDWVDEQKYICYTDEMKWDLQGSDSHMFNEDDRKEPLVLARQQVGGNSIMIWVVFHQNENS